MKAKILDETSTFKDEWGTVRAMDNWGCIVELDGEPAITLTFPHADVEYHYGNPVTSGKYYSLDMMLDDMRELRLKARQGTITAEEEGWLIWAEEKMDKWSDI